MSTAPQKGAAGKHRARLAQRGIKRFEMAALETDESLFRTLERRLAADGPKAGRIRATVKALISDEDSMRGGILAAFRRSPMVGADLDLSRPHVEECGTDF